MNEPNDRISNEILKPSIASLFKNAYSPELRTEFPSGSEMDEVFKKARYELAQEKSIRKVDSTFAKELMKYLEHTNGKVEILDTTFNYFQDALSLESFVNMLIYTALSYPVTVVLINPSKLSIDAVERQISITLSLVESNVTIRWINQVIPSSTFRFGSRQLIITRLIDDTRIASVISEVETLNNVYRQYEYALSISEIPEI